MKIVEVLRERERERESSNLENAKGVTLIALVITIIVLLILAGVVLNTVLGNDGIIAKAQLAKEKTNNVQIEEQEKLNDLENELANYSIRANNLASTTIYPQGGTEENPPTITTNARIEVDNPYPGHNVYATVEIKVNDLWGETGWIYSPASGQRSYGIEAFRLYGENYDKIIIQTGNSSITGQAILCGNPFGNGANISSAQYKLNVICLD